MKRIVVCFDGTWNALTDPTSVTNVVRVGQAVRSVDDNNVAQVVYYNAGVGSGGPLDRFLGGVFGVGLRDNVKRGLAFLTLNWQPGDEIYIFGFSRGAYSARALAGVITAIRGVPRQEYFHELEKIWNFYRLSRAERAKKEDDLDKMVARPEAKFLVTCLAVWDTVGSYGVPAGLGLGGLARRWTSWTRGFHDNMLHPRIKVALQALAIDEARRAFPATTWLVDPSEAVEEQIIEQVWFAGTHSNVGGGYGESGLSDMALVWIMARVEEHTGLRFSESYIGDNFWPCSACSLYRSARGWWLSTLWPNRRAVFAKPSRMEVYSRKEKRRVTREVEPAGEKVHWSVIERLGRDAIVDEKVQGSYAPRNLPLEWNVRRWREEARPMIEENPKVARATKREEDLIDRCRAGKNDRRQQCALHCDYSGKPHTGMFGPVRNLLSAPLRRDKRMRGLRKIWNMANADGP